ncbi:hypothetical protein FPRO06_07765 [Fusarium proliferatum]|nr:hypothetical protein FPRO06_07765 [Fusarium proliferatum]
MIKKQSFKLHPSDKDKVNYSNINKNRLYYNNYTSCSSTEVYDHSYSHSNNTEEALATVTIGGGKFFYKRHIQAPTHMHSGEVYCNIDGNYDPQDWVGVALVEYLNEPILINCKTYCLTIYRAVSFALNPNFCICLAAGARPSADESTESSFKVYDLTCDMAERGDQNHEGNWDPIHIHSCVLYIKQDHSRNKNDCYYENKHREVTETNKYVVTKTLITTRIVTRTVPITEVYTVTFTGINAVTEAVGSTVTVTHATIQTVLFTITASVSAITATAEATTIWG